MRIGIDARFYSVAGPGRYEKNLIKCLEKLDKKNEYFIFLRKDNFTKYQPQSSNFKKILADYLWYSFKEQLFMPFKIYITKIDLMHFPHFNIPLFYFGPFVLTIHDLIMHAFSTQRATTRSKPYYKFKRLIYKYAVQRAVKRAQKIFVPSEATKHDLVRILGVNDEKIVVTYEGVDDKFKMKNDPFDNTQGHPLSAMSSRSNGERSRMDEKLKIKNDALKKYGIRKPYLLYLGSMYPHKNVENLLKAFKLLKERYGFKGKLVLVGKKDYFSQRMEKESENLGLGGSVIFPGHIHKAGYTSDEELVEIFRQARVFVFPSLKEGFGLPLLEAMSLKVPVVASNVSSIPEICQDAAYFFDPEDVKDMALKTHNLLTDNNLRQNLISKGILRIRKFSWNKMAEKTLEVYQGIKL